MRRFMNARYFLAVALFTSLSAFAQGNYKAEPLNSPPPSEVPKALQDAVQPQGVKYVDDQGKPLAEVWLAKTLTGQASPNSSGDVIYGSVDPGAFVGVLHYPDGGSDFRGQNIKSGFYTLRYDLIPQDGNHMGVSIYRDFLLLMPVAQDTDPDVPLKYDDAVKLSRKASGTGHPAVLCMDPTDAVSGQPLPAAFQDDSSNWALAAKTQVKPAGGAAKDLTLAFVLVGKYQG
jgi:hypothetical protein